MRSFAEIVSRRVAETFVIQAEVTQDLLLCAEAIQHSTF